MTTEPQTLPNAGLTGNWPNAFNGWGTANNTNLRMVDALMFLTVLSAPADAPPSSPSQGDRYIVGTAPTGAWASNANAVTVWTTDETGTELWEFFAPQTGWEALVLPSSGPSSMYQFNAGAWSLINPSGVSTLAGLSDVNVEESSGIGDYLLSYDLTSGKWVASPPTAVFGRSGSLHSSGLVPDPGSVAGATRFLREDGSWRVPAGGSTVTSGGGADIIVVDGADSVTVSSAATVTFAGAGIAVGEDSTNPNNVIISVPGATSGITLEFGATTLPGAAGFVVGGGLSYAASTVGGALGTLSCTVSGGDTSGGGGGGPYLDTGVSTLDPSDMDQDSNLSSDFLTLSCTGGSWQGVRSTLPRSDMLRYFEVEVMALDSSNQFSVGVASTRCPVVGWPGSGGGFDTQSQSVAYSNGYGNGVCIGQNRISGTLGAVSVGDVFQVLVNFTPGSLAIGIGRNGTWVGSNATFLGVTLASTFPLWQGGGATEPELAGLLKNPGGIFAHIVAYGSTVLKANFGATEFTHAPPAGAVAWG